MEEEKIEINYVNKTLTELSDDFYKMIRVATCELDENGIKVFMYIATHNFDINEIGKMEIDSKELAEWMDIDENDAIVILEKGLKDLCEKGYINDAEASDE